MAGLMAAKIRTNMDSKKVSYAFPDGREYVGEVLNNLPNGQGTMTFANGDVYEGTWKDGNMDGKGTYRFYDVEKDKFISEYVGDFRSNKIEGEGKRTYADKTVYIGTWQNDMRTGNGAAWFKDGSYFYGIWKFDQMIRGLLHLSSGDIYDGEIKNGLFNGFGKYICVEDGSVFEGLFKDGKPLKGVKIFANETIERIAESDTQI